MTKALGYQKEVFNVQEAIVYFRASNYEDCSINTYPSFTKYDGINRTAPSFLMIDIDLDFVSNDKLDRAMKRVLKKIETVMQSSYCIVNWEWLSHLPAYGRIYPRGRGGICEIYRPKWEGFDFQIHAICGRFSNE